MISAGSLSGGVQNMPPLPPAEGVTRAVLNYTSQGIVTANVLHFTAPPGPTAPDPEDLGERLAGWWNSQIKPQVPASQILVNVTCTDLSASGPPSTIVTTGLPSAGTVPSEPLPNNAALVMSLVTGLRGRSFRGRIYHGGLTEDTVNGNNVIAVRRDALVASYSQLVLFTELGFPDYQLVVLSYFSGGALRPTPIATPVTVVQANSTIDTQRRRMR